MGEHFAATTFRIPLCPRCDSSRTWAWVRDRLLKGDEYPNLGDVAECEACGTAYAVEAVARWFVQETEGMESLIDVEEERARFEGDESVAEALHWGPVLRDRIADLERDISEVREKVGDWTIAHREKLEAHESRISGLEGDEMGETGYVEPDRGGYGREAVVNVEDVGEVWDFLASLFGGGPLEGVRYRVLLLALAHAILLGVRGETLDSHRTARDHLIEALNDLRRYLAEHRQGPQSATEYLDPGDSDGE